MNQWPWSVLETDAGADERTVRRAYARILKQQRADDDPDAFQALRNAYEHALQLARNAAAEGTTVAVDAAVPEPARQGVNEASGADTRDVAPSAVAERPPVRQRTPSTDSLPLHASDPAAEAAQIWAEFTADAASVTSRREIKVLFGSIVNIALRDELEWAALMYCLRDDIPPDSRTDIADALNWRDNAAHLFARNAYLAGQALSKIFAQEEYAQARRHFPHAVALLERPSPRLAKALFALRARTRHREMEQLLYALQVSFGNARNLRFDGERIAFWRNACLLRTKAIHLCMTAPAAGLWCGLLLEKALSGLAPAGVGGRSWTAQGSIAVFAMLLTTLVYGIVEFRAPTLSQRWRRVARERMPVRYGWIVLWVAATCAAYADSRMGAVTSAALAALSIATWWALAVHGWPRLAGLAIIAVYAACGFGFVGYYMLFASGSWMVPLGQAVLYGMFAGFVQMELHAMVERRRALRIAATVAWFAAGVTVAFSLMGMQLSDFSPAWSEPTWSAYAALIVVGSMLGTMQWAQLGQILPQTFLGLMYMLWTALAIAQPRFAAFVALCLMSYWIVQGMRRQHVAVKDRTT
ncbi:hypothetical protein KDW49_14275 [Burkholderia dolosa]|uniref:hypothetical protein n=1 Tax=Burkholderia dolosa TaxID=152500 RepID=UPI001B932048|nr:hypothetical protein [Burkholderia dolosa]MBR8301871.1 hypothetical protein [Burkholderia dolosa]